VPVSVSGMHFFTYEKRIKRDARRLRNSLARYGHDLKYTKCLDLMARLHGFVHFSQWQNTIWDGPLSPFDDDADDETVEARFQHQERVMAEAGFADVAGAVLDEVNPTGRRKSMLCSDNEFADDAAATSNLIKGSESDV